jgi:hypothetical protein
MRGWTTADLTGRTFGRWAVLERAPRVPKQGEAWRCRCACGTERVITAATLLHGRSRSCGCVTREILREKRPWQRRDLRGQVVGELRVLRPGPNIPARTGNPPGGHTAWYCECACGRVVLIPTGLLTHRRPTTHCGCRHLKPALEPAQPATAPAPAPAPTPAPAAALDPPERITTGQQWLDRFHDENSPLGRVSRPEPEDDSGGVLHDFDPFDF